MSHTLNLRGLACPLPVIRARKAIAKLPAGTEIVIECTDPLASIDIPHMCQSDGHILRETGNYGDVLWFKAVVKTA
jgi:tRNA 2-thiouridine synthesizing protein A